MGRLSEQDIYKIARRVAGKGTRSGGSSYGGGGITLAQVEESYVSKEFFNRLFVVTGTKTVTVTDDGGEPVGDPVVTSYTFGPNEVPSSTSETDDTTGETTTTVTAITAIQALGGLWTNSFVSALGRNSEGGGGGGGDTLTEPLHSINNAGLGAPSQSGVAIVWNGSRWTYGTTTPDLSSYATKSWVQQQGYLTSSALSGYATQTWVKNQGYATQTWVNSNAMRKFVTQSGADLNTMTDAGSYRLSSSALNRPATDDWSQVLTVCGGGDTVAQMFFPYERSTAYLRCGNPLSSSGSWKSWRELAFTDSNIATATRLQDNTNKSLFGNTYWSSGQPQSVATSWTSTANLNYVANIYMYGALHGVQNLELNTNNNTHATDHGGYIDFHFNGSTSDYTSRIIEDSSGRLALNRRLFVHLDGNVGIGNSSPSYLLDVNGIIHNSSDVRTDGNLYMATSKHIYMNNLSALTYNGTQFLVGFGFRDNSNTHIYGQQISFYPNNTFMVGITTSGLRIGDAMLSWDSTNNALKVSKHDGTSANFYALGGVSALGFSGAGGSPEISSLTVTDSIKAKDYAGSSLNVLSVTKATSSTTTNILKIGEGWGANYHDTQIRGFNINLITGNNINAVYINSQGLAVFNSYLRSSRYYLDTTRYLYLNGSSLMYYNGSSTITIA